MRYVQQRRKKASALLSYNRPGVAHPARRVARTPTWPQDNQGRLGSASAPRPQLPPVKITTVLYVQRSSARETKKHKTLTISKGVFASHLLHRGPHFRHHGPGIAGVEVCENPGSIAFLALKYSLFENLFLCSVSGGAVRQTPRHLENRPTNFHVTDPQNFFFFFPLLTTCDTNTNEN